MRRSDMMPIEVWEKASAAREKADAAGYKKEET